MPAFSNKTITGTELLTPDPSLQWLPHVHQPQRDEDTGWLHMKIGSYNVSSIKEAGRAALLREQAEYYGFHVIGLQETRTVLDDPCDSNFVRLTSASQGGVGGCELWLARSQPYGRNGDTPCYFQRQYAQVVHADEQILLTTYHASRSTTSTLLCCTCPTQWQGHRYPTALVETTHGTTTTICQEQPRHHDDGCQR